MFNDIDLIHYWISNIIFNSSTSKQQRRNSDEFNWVSVFDEAGKEWG